MKHLALALTCLLLCALPASAVTQTCIIVTVYDANGAPIANTNVMRKGASVPKRTDTSGTTFWCLAIDQTATELSVDGQVVKASARNGTATARNGIAYVTWQLGTENVYISLSAAQLGPTPTPTNTPGPTATLYPTMTLGPSPTPRQTELPPADLPWALFDIESTNMPGRVIISWKTGNGAVCEIYSGSDGSLIEFLEVNAIETSGRARFVVYDANQLYPPTVTPSATSHRTTTPTATRTALPTIKPTPPDAAPECWPTPSSLEDGAAQFRQWARDNYGVDPWVIMELGK